MRGADIRRVLRDYPLAMKMGAVSRRDRAVPSTYTVGTQRPVVIIPGVYEQWHYLRPVADALSARGHAIHTVPAMGRNNGPIPTAADQVARVILELDLTGVAIVAHSKGGLIGKLAMSGAAGERIDRVVALATPFGGSTLARWMPNRALRAFLPSDPVIRSMVAQVGLNSRITSIFPRIDPHIPGGSHLVGAHNVELDLVGHFGILRDPAAIAAVIAAVESKIDDGERRAPTGV